MKGILKLVITLFFILLLLVAIYNNSNAEEVVETETVWVLCKPATGVNLRAKPKKSSREVGGVFCGDELTTDDIEKNGYLHIVNLAAEELEAWISLRYIVYSPPIEIEMEMQIKAKGKVKARKWVDGPHLRYVRNGDIVYVYWMTNEWAVTNRGYIKSEFLNYIVEDDYNDTD